MAVRLVCQACGKRLKLPDGIDRTRSAKCPKCLAPVDLTTAMEASAYLPTVAVPAAAAGKPPPPTKPPPLPAPSPPLPVPMPVPATTLAKAEEALSLDDDDSTAPPAEPEPPFRVPVCVLADSLRQVGGACFAVLVPHGVFLEHEPMKPFLYVPVGCPAEAPAPGELTVTLPDRRTVTFRFATRYARPLARDTIAFLAGKRPVPVARDYRRKWWMLWAALIFVLLGVTAFLAGRQNAIEEAKPEVPPPGANTPGSPNPPPVVPPSTPSEPQLSHLERAKKNGSSALEDGPADVTALALAPDGNSLGIGYADGSTRIWPLDQRAFDDFLPGPKADGPVSRVQFDSKNQFVFAHGPMSVVAAPRNGPSMTTAKLPGFPVAIAPEPDGERIRIAAVRNNLQLRLVATTFLQNPPKGKEKGYAVPGKTDEITPAGLKDPAKPPATTFFAWTPGDKLLAGQPDGSILVWSNALKSEAASRDHKAAVKAWASCPATGSFATGDEQGAVGIWSAKGGNPTVTPAVLSAPITGLSFNATGSRLILSDGSGWLVIWDVATAKAVHRVKRPVAIKAMAAGPTDDVILIAAGKTVEVWWLPELVK